MYLDRKWNLGDFTPNHRVTSTGVFSKSPAFCEIVFLLVTDQPKPWFIFFETWWLDLFSQS